MSASPSRAARAGRLSSIVAIALTVVISGVGVYLFAGGSGGRGHGTPPCATGQPCGEVAAPADPVVLLPASSGGVAQAGVVGEPFARPLSVRVLDAAGRPVPGVTVSFGTSPSAEGAGARLSAPSAVSDAQGYASVTVTANLTPSERGGGYQAWASVGGQVIDFSLRNYDPTAPADARLVGERAEFIAAGRDQPISIRVVNAVGAGVAGVPVSLARNTLHRGPSGLDFTPATAVTDGHGYATFTARGSATGTGVLDVVVAGAPLASLGYQVYAAAVATQIKIISGGNQFAAPGVAFADPVVFELDDASGLPVSDTVTASVTFGPGSVTPTTIPTDARGRGQVTVTALGYTGDVRVNFALGLVSNYADLTVGDPASRWLRLVDGNESWSPPNQAFTKPLSVRVVDGTGTPVAGVNVLFAQDAANTDITLSAASTISDVAGLASVDVTAGTTTGWNLVTASIAAGGMNTQQLHPIVVNTTAVGYFQVVSGGGQGAYVSSAFAQPLVVRLVHYDGTPVAGANVTWTTTPEFSANATTSPSSPAVTDSSGQVALSLTANNWPGKFTVDFSSSEYFPIPLVFHVPFTNLDRVLPGPATNLVVKSGNNQSALLTAAFGLPLEVLVTDAVGVPVDGVVVNFAAPASGASATLSAPSATTSIFGVASVTATAITSSGTYNVVASANGLASANFQLTNVAPTSNTLLESSPNPSTYGNPVTFTATVTSGPTFGITIAPVTPPTGTVTFSAGATTLCAAVPLVTGVANCTVSSLGAGANLVTATYSGDGSNTGSIGTVTQNVNQAAQAITFTPPAAATYGDAPIDLAASATGGGSGNPVTFSVVSGPGTISGSTLTITGAGTIVVAADQAGDANHTAAPQVQASITVAKATATVTLVPASLAVTYDGAPKLAAATTAPAGLTVDFTYDGTAVAPTNAGSYAVVATVNDANYVGTTSGTLVIAKAAQVVVFVPGAPPQYYGDPPIDVSAYAIGGGSGNPIVFAVVSGPGTLAGSMLTMTGTGDIVLSASQDGNANYLPSAPVQGTITVIKRTATVTLGAASLSVTYDGSPKAVAVTTDPAGLAVDVTYAGAAAPPTNAGAYAVVATVNDAYYQGTASGTLTIAKAAQAITFTPPASGTYGGAPIDLSAHASGGGSGNPVTFAVVSGPGSLAGALLTFTGTGAVVVSASQAGSANYADAPAVQATITVGKSAATVTLTAASLSVTYDGSPKVVGVTTAPAGLTVDVTYDGSATAPTNAGSYAVVATVNDPNYVGTASGTLTIAKAAQAIAFAPPATKTYLDAPFDLAASATGGGSGLPVTFAVVSGPGSLAGSVLSLTGAGAVVVSASQAGNANYAAATTVQATISVAKYPATIQLSPVYLTVTYDGLQKHAGVTTSPVGLNVDVTYDGSATAPTNVGTYAVVATVNDPNYQGTANGTVTINKASQAITFTPPGTATYGDAALDLSTFVVATASGNPVTFTVASGPGSVAGALLTFTGAGAVVVVADQAGSANYTAALPVQATINVAKAATLVAITPSVASPVSGQAVDFKLDVTAAGAIPTGTVSLLDGATLLGTATLAAGTGTVSLPGGLLVGSHALSATYGGDANVLAAAPATLTYVVGKAPTAVALASSRPDATTNQPITFTATVSPTAGAGTPSGVVTFKDGTATLGTGVLSAGVATVTVRSFAKGTHPITADYAGDAEFQDSSGTLAGGQVVPKSSPVAGSGSAVAFDGETQDARIEDANGTFDVARTVELWFKAQPGTGVACLAQQGEGDGLRFGLCLNAAHSGLLIRRGAEVSSIPVTIGTGWHHVALAAGDTATVLYLDGLETASLAGGFGTGSQQPVVIAAAPLGAGATDRFAGTVDELRLWSTTRTATDIATSARQPVAGDAAGLLGLWRFDEGAGPSLFDAGPSHLEATLTAPGAASWVASDAWKRRTTLEERLLPPFLAGYDPDGDPFTVTLVTAPQGGLATVAGATITYMPKDRFLGVDSFTYQVSAGGLTSQFTTEVDVTRIELCQVQSDCAGGDTCVNGFCTQPVDTSSNGCSCASSGQGAPTALLALLLLALLGHRRFQPGAARRGR